MRHARTPYRAPADNRPDNRPANRDMAVVPRHLIPVDNRDMS
ncbi:hypothetical protein JOF41_006437 [Saccharothrix coeruleofusca]|nr:hypothetical protein [Saccharothrix coeruleofusca]MBP2340259.1 hypothetical protein [Saccharothrix coeruleofusca]